MQFNWHIYHVKLAGLHSMCVWASAVRLREDELRVHARSVYCVRVSLASCRLRALNLNFKDGSRARCSRKQGLEEVSSATSAASLSRSIARRHE